jgi:hypothetical protein
LKLSTPFIRFPIRFDADRLGKEAHELANAAEWEAPLGREVGDAVLRLDLVGGRGPIYLMQVLAAFETVIANPRLVRFDPGCEPPDRIGLEYYWKTHQPIHLPILTVDGHRAWSGGKDIEPKPGEAWLMDTWRPYRIDNPGGEASIHLCVDTCGTAAFWDRAYKGDQPFNPKHEMGIVRKDVVFAATNSPELPMESVEPLGVMTPGELEFLVSGLVDALEEGGKVKGVRSDVFREIVAYLVAEWRATWAQKGKRDRGSAAFRSLVDEVLRRVKRLPGDLVIPANGANAFNALSHVLKAALAVEPETQGTAAKSRAESVTGLFDRPTFIVSAPRSGSTLLFETLANNMRLWTLGGEGRGEIERIDALNTEKRGYHSNRITEDLATPKVRRELVQNYLRRLQNSRSVLYRKENAKVRPKNPRFLEKTPMNSLRIPFFKALFPDALFIYLHRNPRDNISSMMDAWRSGGYVTYPKLPDWEGPPWSLLLPPGWREFVGKPTEEIAAFQWATTNDVIIEDLSAIPKDDWCVVSYESFVGDPAGEIKRLCEFMDIQFGPRLREVTSRPLRLSRHTLEPPDPDKWRNNEAELSRVLPDIEAVAERVRAFSEA